MVNHSDFATQSVPAEQRQNWKQMLFVWFGWVFATSNLLSGGVAGNSLYLGSAIWAILVGSIVLAIVGILQARTGAKTGLSTYVLCRYAFGHKGASLVSIVFSITFIGWFGVGVSLAAEAATNIVPINEHILAFIMAVLMMITALYGFRGLEILSKIAVPIVILICIWGIYKVSNNGFLVLFSKAPAEPMSFGSVVVSVIGAWISAAIVAPDIARYAKSEKDAIISTSIAFIIGNSLLMWVGAILAVSVGNWDLVAVLAGLGMGAVGMIFLILVQWTTSDNNLYSAGLGLANMLNQNNKFKVTFVAGVIGVILATAGIYKYFINWLIVLGIVLPPVAGILIVDSYLFPQKYNISYQNISVNYSPAAISSWVIGIIAGKYVTWGSSSINAIIITALSYYILSKLLGSPISVEEKASQ